MIKSIKTYIHGKNGTAAVESALLFPTLIMMLVSMVDIGNGILSNQKLIGAAQMTADLVTRETNPTLEQRAEAILAGQVSMSPYSIASYEYNVTSYEFDQGGSPEIVWQETSGPEIGTDITNGLSDLGGPGEGVVVTVVQYTYTPFFTGFVLGPIHMQEVAYLRGRKSAVVGEPL